MKIKFNTKYNTIAFYTVVVFAICIVLVLLAFRLGTFIAAIRRIMTAISPVIWGFIIAYIMSPIVRKTEEFLEKKVFHKKKHEKIRTVSDNFGQFWTVLDLNLQCKCNRVKKK